MNICIDLSLTAIEVDCRTDGKLNKARPLCLMVIKCPSAKSPCQSMYEHYFVLFKGILDKCKMKHK